jgi:hypothetical protein
MQVPAARYAPSPRPYRGLRRSTTRCMTGPPP